MSRRPVLESTGFSPQQRGGLQRALDGLDAYSIPYTPADPSAWASPAPNNVGDALDRLVAVASSPP